MSDPYRAALQRLAFARDPDPHALPGFGIYRELIRGRLFALASVAYRRAWTLLGAPACEASFARYLEAAPPSSPLVREVVHGFAAFACADELGEARPYARDLLRFEAAKWEVSDLFVEPPPRADELDFEGVPVLNPSLRVLALGFHVDEADVLPTPMPHALLLYRRAHDDAVRWYRAEPLFGALLARLAAHGESLGVALPALLTARGVAADASFLADLTDFLALAIERGVVLGVRSSVS